MAAVRDPHPSVTRAVLPRAAPGLAITFAGFLLVAFNMRLGVVGVPPILDDLGIGAVAQSILVTIPVVCFAGGALAVPPLRRRLGDERAIFAVTALLLAGLVLRAIWPDGGLFAGTVAVGLGIAALNVLLPGLVKRRFPGRAGLATGAYTMVLVAGAALVAGIIVPVFESSGRSEHVALGVLAISAALALALWSVQLRVGPAELGAGQEGIRRPVLARSGVAWALTWYFGLQSLLYYAALSWVPQIYTDRGVSDTDAGLLLMAMSITGIPGSLLAPMIGERMRDQRVVVSALALGTFAGLAGILAAPTSTALLWVALFGVAQGGTLSIAMLMIVLRSGDGDTAARLSSMCQGGGYLIAMAGPLAMGLLQVATGSWTAALLLLMATNLVSWWPGLVTARSVVIRGPE